jgi:cell division protein FtsB
MKDWWEKYLGIILNLMVLLFALLMAIVPLRYDIIQRDQNGKFERVTKGGIAFFIFAFFALGFGFWKILYDNKESDKTNARLERILGYDSSLNERLAEQKRDNSDLKKGNEQLQRQLDELKNQTKASTDTLLKSRPKIDPRPRLNLCPLIYGNRLNPVLTTTANNNMQLEIGICNSGNTAAYNLQDGAWVARYRGDTPEITRIPGSIFNKSIVIVPNQPPVLMPYTSMQKNYLFYFCLQINYTDSTNRKVKPLRKILVYNQLNNKFEELNGDEYDRVSNDLIHRKFWRKY